MTTAALIAWEPALRGAAFVTVLVGLAIAERFRPCRGDAKPAQ